MGVWVCGWVGEFEFYCDVAAGEEADGARELGKGGGEGGCSITSSNRSMVYTVECNVGGGDDDDLHEVDARKER